MSIRKLVCAASSAACCAAAVLASAGEIRGRVLVDGKPDATVVVRALPFEDAFAEARREARREELPKPLGETTPRPDGNFALNLTAPAGAVVRLAFSGPKLAPRVLEALLDAAGDDAGETRLAKAVALAGRVVDERGAPVVGATLSLWPGGERGMVFLDAGPAARGTPQLATTKPDGSFRFETASAEGNRLRVEAPAFATLERQPLRGGAIARPLVLALGQVLRGSVTLADHKTPAKGALVRFEGRTQTTRWVEARADGGFAIDGAPREPGALVADAGPEGRGSTVLTAAVAERTLIALAPTATLSGRVVDAEGARPLPNVRLVARAEGASFLARSGPDGRYAIRGLSPRRYQLSAEDDRFVPWSRSVSVAAGQAEAQDVPLARAATLAGRVVDAEGVPIEGARVQLLPSGENVFRAFMRRMDGGGGAVRSGKDGGFKATRLAPGENQRLDVRHDDYEERAIGGISLQPGATRGGLTVVMRRGLTLRGVVKDEQGQPLGGAEVELQATRSFRAGRGGVQMEMIGPGSQVRHETGVDGRFEFRGLKPGDYTVSARRPGFARASVDPVKVADTRAAEPLVLVLRPGATISGVLHDKLGNGASGWYVGARGASQGGGPPLGPGSNRSEEPTGPDGAFLLEGLTAGESYELQALGGSGLGPRKPGVVAPADGIELTVNGTGQIRGRVVDADTGRPVSDFQVRYEPDAQGGMRFFIGTGRNRGRAPYERQPFHAEDGAFVLEDVPAGRWAVEAFAQGYQSGSVAAISVGEGDASDAVEVRLTRGGVLSGRVVESRTGKPILDATVRAEAAGGGGRRMGFRIGGESEDETSTDADGRYELAGLAPGSWVVTASHPDWSEATASVEIKDAPASADIRLGRGGSVGGAVLAAGRPVAGATVTLAASGDAGMRPGMGFMGGGEQTTLSDEGGRFRFERLSPGRYQLGAGLRDQTSAPAEAVLTGDDSQEVQLTLAAGALVKGVVSGLPEPQLAGVNVNASGQDYFAATRTAAGGSFELSGVPEGTLTLRANAGDFMSSSRSAQASVTIAAGQPEATAELVFEPGFRVDGHVTRGGRPVTEAMVSAYPEGGGSGRSASARTDDGGGYVLEGLDSATYNFVANAQAGAPIRRTLEIGGDTTVDLEAPPARLAGTVVEADSGRPLGDVSVRIEDETPGARFVNMNTTDSSGRFEFEDMEPKAYRVSFQKAAYQVESRQLQAAEESDLRIELRRGDGIALEAKDGIFATPLRGLFVRVTDSGGAPVFAGSVSLDSDGRGEVPSLKAGVYELRAESSGYAPVRLPSVAVPSRTLSLLLTPGGSLEIQAGPTTLALPQPTGRLIGVDGRVYLWNSFSTDGKIRLSGPLRRVENVAPGAYTFEVEGGVRREVQVAEGGRAVVSLP